MVKMGFIGAGTIAVSMAKTINEMDCVEGYAVAARDLERAKSFAKKYGFQKAYGSYEEMLLDDDVQLVYIATPHSHHFKHAKMCLEAGKNVLCEKAFTVNAKQARTLFALAKEKNLFLTEAIWTRYMPARKMINDIMASGVIGEITSLTANIGYVINHVERIKKAELAGGALLDISIYPINFTRMVFGTDIKEVKAQAVFENGVDMIDSITMIYKDGKMATLQSNACAALDRKGTIFGTKGCIEVTNINNPEIIRVFDKDHREVASYVPPKQISGYEYEVESCVRAMEKGELECPEMPHEETIRVMELMDGIRESWGYEIPEIE